MDRDKKGKNRGLSKYLSYLLRHGAIKKGYKMDDEGYVRVDELISKLKTTLEELKEIVDSDNKNRFELYEKNKNWYIRAVQGHSIELAKPKITLIENVDEIPIVIHGTNTKAFTLIQKNGLNKMDRTHIHFTTGLPSDGNVISGIRNSANVLVYIDVQKAMNAGIKFYRSDNGVILSDGINGIIPSEFFSNVIFLTKDNNNNKKKGNIQ